jgi:hypothetical protein
LIGPVERVDQGYPIALADQNPVVLPRLQADAAAAFDSTPEWNDCDLMTALSVMES